MAHLAVFSKPSQPKYTEFATLLTGLFPVSLLTIYKYAIKYNLIVTHAKPAEMCFMS